MNKKIISLSIATIFALQSLTPIAYAKEEDNFSYVIEEVENLDITHDQYIEFINEFNKSLNEDGIILTKDRGLKSKSAKVAAKAMKKALYKIGSRSFNKAIKAAAKILPEKAEKIIVEKVTYSKVSAVLNIVANVEGTITDALTNQLAKIMPRSIAKMAARAIIFILL